MNGSRSISVILLILILALAAAIRLPGIYWGDGDLKQNTLIKWHVDEKTHVDVASQFLSGKINYDYDYVKGFGLHMAAVGLMGKLTNLELSTGDLHRVGRGISFFYGLAVIVLLYITVLMISNDESLALLSASFLALCSLAATNSHFAVADMASVFWIWTTALLCWFAVRDDSWAASFGAWASLGMALGIKIAFAAGAPLMVIGALSKSRIRVIISGVSIAFLFFFLVNGLGIGLDGLLKIYGKIIGDSVSVIPYHTRLETIFTWSVSIFPAFSLPLIILAIIGMVFLVIEKKGSARDWGCFASPFIAHAFLICFLDDSFERHLLPFAPAICGLAAYGWKMVLPNNGRVVKKVFCSLPLFGYLFFFAIDGEYPFWKDNRIHARNHMLNEASQGSRVLVGPYAWLNLPREKFHIKKVSMMSKHPIYLNNFDFIILHEFHTYRYFQSRLSPFQKPQKDNIYHPDHFGEKYLDKLMSGALPFKLVRTFSAPGQWSLERAIYKKYLGTFTSFVGDVYIFSRIPKPARG